MLKRDAIIEVPHTVLSPEALRRLVEEFVTRDGTDYGTREKTLEDKILAVMQQLERGEARIVFDPQRQVANIVRSK